MIHVFFFLVFAQPDLAALKRETRGLSKPSGCARVADCKVLPMGSKPCGGPTEFLVYCATSTDEKALEAKAKRVTDTEKAVNAAQQSMSICTALTPPKVKLQNGVCTAASTSATDVPM